MVEEKKMSGYPSIDRPWLKYYSEEAINTPLPESSLYDYLYECNREHMDDYALNYFGRRITFKELYNVLVDMNDLFVTVGEIANESTWDFLAA